MISDTWNKKKRRTVCGRRFLRVFHDVRGYSHTTIGPGSYGDPSSDSVVKHDNALERF